MAKKTHGKLEDLFTPVKAPKNILPKVIVRTKKIKHMDDGSVLFNARSVEVNGLQIPFVSGFDLAQDGHGIMFLTVKIPVGELTTITED